MIRSSVRVKAVFASCLLVMAASSGVALAGEVWSNIRTVPDDLINSVDAWTAARVNDVGQESFRIAADDFILNSETTLDSLVFYTAAFGDPDVSGGDWYIYTVNGDTPGKLVASGSSLKMDREDTGWVNAGFGPIFRNTLDMGGVTLAAGRYFLAFRSIMSCPSGCTGKYSIYSTRWVNGDSRALWNFGVQADGTVTDDWMLLQDFNQVQDQEWAFELHSGGSVDCDKIRKLKAKCNGGKLKAKVKSTLPSGTTIGVSTGTEQRELIIGDRGTGKVKFRKQSGRVTVFLMPCRQFEKTTDCN